MKDLVRGARVLPLLACLLVAGGCTRKSDTGNGAGQDTFRVAHPDEPRRLDPAHVKDLFEGIVSGLIYDQLVVFGKGAEVEPGLAESWTLTQDGRTYTFRLRDAHFSNGNPVTSADVRYSLTRVLLPGTHSDRKWVLNRIDGADELTSGTARELRGLQTPDSRTVAITLRKPYPVFLKMLAMPTASIIPESSAEATATNARFDDHPVGSGAWSLRLWLHDRRIEFARNDFYWGIKPRFPNLIYQIMVDDNVRRREFEAGNLDLYQVGFTAYSAWMADPRKAGQIVSVQELRTDYLGLMCSKPYLSDTRVRRAIAHAINREGIFRNLQKGRGVLANSPVPPGVTNSSSSWPFPYSPSAAKTLLSEAAGGAPLAARPLYLWYRDESLNSEIAAAIRKDLAVVGIEAIPTPRDQAALRTGIWEGVPDMYLGSWTLDYPDVENAIVPPFHSRNIPRQGNQCHFKDPEVDRLLDEAESQGAAQRRLGLLDAATSRIVNEVPWVVLFHPRTYYAHQEWVHGWRPALMYNADRFNDVEMQSDAGRH